MKAIKSNGLIPVKLTRSALPYRKGDVHGFNPVLVGRMLSADPPECELVDIPDGIETIDVEVNVTVKNDIAEPTPEAAVVLVAIPDEWESLHHLKRVKLAQNFDPSVTTAEDANKIIAAEIARRAA